MALGNHIHGDFTTNPLRNMQQAKFIGNRRLAFAHFFRHFLLSNLKLLNQTGITLSFFKIIQILTLQIFNQRHLGNFPIT